LQRSNRLILIVSLVIVCLGILSIYSSTYQKEGELWKLIYKRQIFWIILGLIFFVLLSNFNYRRFWDLTYFLYAVLVFLLLLVFILGIVRLGAQRWIRFGWFNFQPSELAKLCMVIFLARYFSTKSVDNVELQVPKFGIFRAFIIPFIFVAVPVGLIIEQPDLGTGMIIVFLFIALMYLGGVKMKFFYMLLATAIISIPVFWNYLRDYQKNRLIVFLNPNIDPLGAGYTVIQSRIAIGSGGLFGKGWLSGTQGQLHFLPEAHTDFIFASFAEEWGLFGAMVLLFLYFLLIREGIKIALSTKDQFGRLLAYGICLMLGVQIIINVSMNLGLAPVVGIPLPLMSYGGSSILITFISLGVLVNIGKRRAVF